MTQFQITLAEDAASYVNEQVAQGKFATPSDVLADALEAKRVQAARERLTELIREGIETPGEDIEFTDEWWEQRMDGLAAEAKRRQSA